MQKLNRIKEISVNKLFGIFDHKIQMKLENRITIIHGPNGFGKTTILRLLYGLFNGLYEDIIRTPFEEFSIIFDDESSLKISKEFIDDKKLKMDINKGKLIFKYKQEKKKILTKILEFYERGKDILIPHYRRERWRYPNDLPIEYRHIRKRYPDMSFRNTRELLFSTEKNIDTIDWLIDLQNKISIHYVKSQRLLTEELPDYDFVDEDDIEPESRIKESVIKYSRELADSIGSILAKSMELSQSLDRSFPSRLMEKLVQQNKIKSITKEEIIDRLKLLEKKRQRLMEVGLIEKKELETVKAEVLLEKTTKELGKDTMDVLSLYTEDTKEKLETYEEFTGKINLMMETINKRFLYKNLSITQDEGFVFTHLSNNSNANNEKMRLVDLSSGEKHQLVLNYELLFKTQPRSLVLIDEPEISLHIIWQEQFLNDLEEITKIADLDVLIATHSPQIINDQWDITVELKGRE